MQDAKNMAKETSKLLELRQREVGVCSTGVIGLPMPMMRIEQKYEELVAGLGPKNGNDVARSILTSDTHEKEFAISFELHGKRVRIGGCAKGAGMINPNMATMLCFSHHRCQHRERLPKGSDRKQR
jgi:glutamate N-acetyltransferase/amino-acid N-acetyltransferase